MTDPPADAALAAFRPAAVIVEHALDALPIAPDVAPQCRQTIREAAKLPVAALLPVGSDEAAAAVQIVILHFVAMECSRRVALPGVTDRAMLQLLGKANAALRLQIGLSRDYEKRRNTTPEACEARAVMAQRLGRQAPPPSAAAGAETPPATPLEAMQKQANSSQKVLQRMAANGVTKGFRPGKLQELAARSA